MIGQNIWNQLTPTTKFSIGAKIPVLTKNGVIFQVRTGEKGTHKIEVTLNERDEYDVKLHCILNKLPKLGVVNCTVKDTKSGISVENLNEVVFRMCHKD